MTCRFYLCMFCYRSFDDFHDLHPFMNEHEKRSVYCAQCVVELGEPFLASINDESEREQVRKWAIFRAELIKNGSVRVIKTGHKKEGLK